MKKLVLTAMAAAMLCAPIAANAGSEQDLAKITCKEFLADKANMPMMIMWIDGYMSAKSDNTVLSDEWIQKLGTHLGTYCSANPAKTIMNAMDEMPAE